MDEKHQLASEAEKGRVVELYNWMKSATIDNCIFNLETSYDNSTDKKQAFLHVFWNEFNGKRGFNKFNISLAQHLEKPLQDKGVFEKFKKAIADMGGDWTNASEAADIIDNELDMVLDIACNLAPSLTRESIRERIIKRDMQISIDRFAQELKGWLKDKGDNYRLILLADEVSQFINKERDRYLNLQEIITKLSEVCDNKVWVACTAQQDLTEVIDDCNLSSVADPEGKIRGRFEVKVSLKGTQPEVITQKRILDKKEEVREDLGALYDAQHQDFELRFKLPNSYDGYTDRDNFIDYYPFVPYQFKLIQKVFNNFLNLGYVAREVKGNERSIIKVVHATAQHRAKAEVGEFISFDELYNNMFEEGLLNKGQRAIQNGQDIARKYAKDPKFALRVVNILFMVCNIDDSEKLQFPASVENIATLLVNDTKTPWIRIRDKVANVVEYLCDNNIIRRVSGKTHSPDSYAFYSEEEMKVADLIKNQTVDNNDQARVINEIVIKYFKSLKNKEQFGTRSFSVHLIVKQRDMFGNVASDIELEFNTDRDYGNIGEFAFHNTERRLVFYMGEMMQENKTLLNQFAMYCKTLKYLETPVPNSENAEIRKKFKDRASEIFIKTLEPEIRKILDNCPVISYMTELNDVELNRTTGDRRFSIAMKNHLASIYTKAELVNSDLIPRNSSDLGKAIVRPIQPGDYEGVNATLTEAEKEVEIYLGKQYGDVNLSEVVTKFAKAPYGWHSISTLYVVNELVRRHRRAYSYGNDRNVDIQTVAKNLAGKTNEFTVRHGVAIDKHLIHEFINAWKYVFGPKFSLGTTDSAELFRKAVKDEDEKSLLNIINKYKDLLSKYDLYSFSYPVEEAVELFTSWAKQRDPESFFHQVITDKYKGKKVMDTVQEVVTFIHDQIELFQELVEYARSNEDNFNLLSENSEMREPIAKLKSLENSSWPIRIREYVKVRETIKERLNSEREKLREEIKEEYNKAYRMLCDSAKNQGVDISVITVPSVVYQLKCKTDNILVLQSYLNTNEYFVRESEKIKCHIVPINPGPTPLKSHLESVVLHLDTRAVNLDSEAAVDAYLAKLKEKIMAKINENKIVTITK